MAYEVKDICVKHVALREDVVYIRSTEDEICAINLRTPHNERYEPLAMTLLPGDMLKISCTTVTVKGSLDVTLYEMSNIVDMKPIKPDLTSKPSGMKP